MAGDARIDRPGTSDRGLLQRLAVFDLERPHHAGDGVVAGDDISVVTALPARPARSACCGRTRTPQRFGFRTHIDGTDPGNWTADEVPASQSAINGVGAGMADDHMNVAVASDGTLYAAVKTSYDTAGYPKMALLVRRPAGTWDNLYGMDESGTRPIVLLDEANGVLTFIYTQSEGNNPIVYRQSALGPDRVRGQEDAAERLVQRRLQHQGELHRRAGHDLLERHAWSPAKSAGRRATRRSRPSRPSRRARITGTTSASPGPR